MGEGRGEGATLRAMPSRRRLSSDPAVRARARELRASLTLTEERLWQALRSRRIVEKFRRQVPLGPFIADFCCIERWLIVEVDGGIHSRAEVAARDRERDDHLRGLGFRILRLTNEEIDSDLDAALDRIESALHALTP